MATVIFTTLYYLAALFCLAKRESALQARSLATFVHRVLDSLYTIRY